LQFFEVGRELSLDIAVEHVDLPMLNFTAMLRLAATWQ
jgi:hypothetical protein